MQRSSRSETKPGLAAMIALAVRERGLELRLSTGLDVEDGLLRDHRAHHRRAAAQRPGSAPSYTRGYTHGGMVTADEGH